MKKLFLTPVTSMALSLVLATAGCIPIFTGSGDEVKSIEPVGPGGPVPLITIVEMAEPLRKIAGRVVEHKQDREQAVKFQKVCLRDQNNNALHCATTDGVGRYNIEARLPAGRYTIASTYNNKEILKPLTIISLKEFEINFSL